MSPWLLDMYKVSKSERIENKFKSYKKKGQL